MDTKAIAEMAQRLAANAKPGVLKIESTTYTFVFDHNEWVYRVYGNGFWLVNFNTKSLSNAKRLLKSWLAS